MPIPVAAAGAIGAAFVDAAAGQARDAMQFKRQRLLNRENNKFNADEARKQRAAAAAAQTRQENYNSEVAQVQRLKQAGLNPALLYGGATSSSGVSSMSAASASPSSYTPTGSQLDLSGALSGSSDMDLQAAQVENLRTNTASQAEDVASKTTTNKYLDSKTNIELLKMLQEYENLKKQGALSQADLDWYERTKTATLAQIQAQTDKALAETTNVQAETTYLEDVKTPLAKSETALNKEKAKTEKTIQDLNVSAEKRNYAEKALSQSQIKNNTAVRNEILRKYGLDKSESDMIEKALDKIGLSKGWTNTVLDLFGEFRKETGKGLGEFFSGDNWINFLGKKYGVDKDFEIGKQRNENDRYRTDEWKKTDDNGIKQQTPENIENDRKISDGAPNDAVRTVPKTELFNKEIQRKWQYIGDRHRSLLNEILKDKYPNWSKEQKDQFKKEMYYARTNKEIGQIINRYYNLK